ncbi:GGDEF domain-containing protein [Xanthobacter sp. V4C-4]|uniref:GGDEF domain-containing protein n=1 Tax=Xanthobacter cornucopiae TaxID=3119924 RepID=UPI003729018F
MFGTIMSDLAAHLRQLQEESPVLFAAFDEADRLRYANAAYRAAYGVAEGESPTWAAMVRRNVVLDRGVALNVTDVEAWLVSALSQRGKTPFRAMEVKLHDGRWLLMNETVAADGWMFCVGCDITELRADVRTVRLDRDAALRAAHTDDLTGVANRRFVTARIDEMLARSAAAPGLPPAGSLCVLDLDNFKYINDRYGHQAGDAILRDFAQRISGQVRRSDCFGRIGGEEFVLVLPDAGREAAVAIVERMLAVVRASRPLADLPDFSYTFSCGVAAARSGDTFAEIYRRADKALYAAKMAGRNRVLVEEPDALPAPAAAPAENGI